MRRSAALAAGAALGAGANAAGAAAGQVYAECHALALALGGKHESFTGVTGTGDLVATVLAATSRNRRAGELLARGVGPGEIHDQLGQVPEAVYTVPALALAMQLAHVHGPATKQLAAVVRGEMPAQDWVRGTQRSRSRHAA